MVPWSIIQTVAFTLGPYLLPRLLAFYRSVGAPSNSPPVALSQKTTIALNALFLSAIIFLATTLPYFSPPNLFALTQSRLQTPTNVLFTRLSVLRSLSPTEKTLQAIFETGGLDARLQYLRFGPETLSSCSFVNPKDADAGLIYLFYALPRIAFPHAFHLALLVTATTSFIAGPGAARWKTAATITALGLFLAELVAIAMYDQQRNAVITRVGEIDAWYWKVRVVRGITVAAVDGLLGWMIYLTATKRGFVLPPPPVERAEAGLKHLEHVLAKISGLSSIRNVVFRDPGMRAKVERYWVHEAEMMRSITEDREVVDALRDTLENVDMARLDNEAGVYADRILGGPPSWQS